MADQQRVQLRPDVTPQAVETLRLAADNMPISRPGQQWSGAADWLRRRARAFEVALEAERDCPPAQHSLSQLIDGEQPYPPGLTHDPNHDPAVCPAPSPEGDDRG